MAQTSSTTVKAVTAVGLLATICVLFALRQEDVEVTRTGWPCWLPGGSCDVPKEEAVNRWKSEKSTEDKELPTIGNVGRWRREARDAKRDTFERDQRIAVNNGLPVPSRSAQGVKTTFNKEGISATLMHQLLSKAVERSKSIASQVNSQTATNPQGKRAAHNGQGLRSAGPSMIGMLKKHPTAQKKLQDILAKVDEAEKAKKDAAQAVAKAAKLQKRAMDAHKLSAKQAKKAATILGKAKAAEKAHKKAVETHKLSEARARSAATRFQNTKTTVHAKKQEKGIQSAKKLLKTART